jgi:hypothetical protein
VFAGFCNFPLTTAQYIKTEMPHTFVKLIYNKHTIFIYCTRSNTNVGWEKFKEQSFRTSVLEIGAHHVAIILNIIKCLNQI